LLLRQYLKRSSCGHGPHRVVLGLAHSIATNCGPIYVGASISQAIMTMLRASKHASMYLYCFVCFSPNTPTNRIKALVGVITLQIQLFQNFFSINYIYIYLKEPGFASSFTFSIISFLAKRLNLVQLQLIMYFITLTTFPLPSRSMNKPCIRNLLYTSRWYTLVKK